MWTYDVGTKAIGKLSEAVATPGPLGTVMMTPSYKRTHVYDALGRPDKTKIEIATNSWESQVHYDAFSRADVTEYPQGATGALFAVQNKYTDLGHLEAVHAATPNLVGGGYTTGSLYWQAKEVDAEGKVRRELLGNGLETVREFGQANGLIERIKTGAASSQMGTGVQYLSFAFDKTGNLMSRGDLGQGVGEVFEYDNLNRLTRSECFSSGKCTYKEYRYDAIGNLTYKSDVGTYYYDYGARPHAVAATTGVVPLSFSYDANGNATSGRQQDIRWSAFNEFRSAAKDGHRTTFFYDSEKQRFRRVDQTAQGDTTQTCYFGQIYELFENLSTGAKEDRYYVFAGGSRIAVHKEKSAGSAETRWLHRDHLDSVQAVTDENGSVVETLSYDAWGRRRNADWSSSPQALNLTAITLNRGFTDHEHIDEIGIIHLNGRVTDPLIGKFLSPDPIIQAPSNPQNFNRYSYVFNNPLSYTDPSGHVAFLAPVIAAVVAATITEAVTAAVIALGFTTTAGALSATGAVIAGAVTGAVAGAVAGAITTGTLRGTLTGAVGGAIGGGVIGWMNGVGYADALNGGVTNQILEGGIMRFAHQAGGALVSEFHDRQAGQFAASANGPTYLDNTLPPGAARFANGSDSFSFGALFNVLPDGQALTVNNAVFVAGLVPIANVPVAIYETVDAIRTGDASGAAVAALGVYPPAR